METIKENHVFRRAYQKGRSVVTPYFVIYLFRNRRKPGVVRYGITTGKKIGNAVERNRARRVLRAAFTTLEERLRPGYEYILVARGRTGKTKSTKLAQVMEKALGEQLLPKGADIPANGSKVPPLPTPADKPMAPQKPACTEKPV